MTCGSLGFLFILWVFDICFNLIFKALYTLSEQAFHRWRCAGEAWDALKKATLKQLWKQFWTYTVLVVLVYTVVKSVEILCYVKFLRAKFTTIFVSKHTRSEVPKIKVLITEIGLFQNHTTVFELLIKRCVYHFNVEERRGTVFTHVFVSGLWSCGW